MACEEYLQRYSRWLVMTDTKTRAELVGLSDRDLRLRFNGYLEFGTAGLRGEMGAGTAYMNEYTVAHATQGFATYILAQTKNEPQLRKVVICFDSRNNSGDFARRSAEVLSANGIEVVLFAQCRPTPELSYAVRHLHCIAGINVTASHNPAKDNGYKAYWKDGAQLSLEQADAVSDAIAHTDIFAVPAPQKANWALIDRSYATLAKLDEDYCAEIKKQIVNPEIIEKMGGTPIVYTPLHGTGGQIVPKLLEKIGFTNVHTVPAQQEPNGNFPTVQLPNPEKPEAFTLGIELAERIGAKIVIATDPDADRCGAMVYNHGEWRHITGNQMGGLLLHYIVTALENQNKLPANSYAIKSIVSSEFVTRICEEHGVTLYNCLTGFKFIGEIVEKNESGKTYAEGEKEAFLLGFEESYGYLTGNYARDKDAVVATMLIAEMAASYAMQEKTLADVLAELFEKYGYFREQVFSIAMEGLEGPAKKQALMDGLRNSLTQVEDIGGYAVTEVRDYLENYIQNKSEHTKTPTSLPESDVLYYVTTGKNVVVVRPSGTEPKVKIYILANGKTAKEVGIIAKNLENGIRKLLGE